MPLLVDAVAVTPDVVHNRKAAPVNVYYTSLNKELGEITLAIGGAPTGKSQKLSVDIIEQSLFSNPVSIRPGYTETWPAQRWSHSACVLYDVEMEKKPKEKKPQLNEALAELSPTGKGNEPPTPAKGKKPPIAKAATPAKGKKDKGGSTPLASLSPEPSVVELAESVVHQYFPSVVLVFGGVDPDTGSVLTTNELLVLDPFALFTEKPPSTDILLTREPSFSSGTTPANASLIAPATGNSGTVQASLSVSTSTLPVVVTTGTKPQECPWSVITPSGPAPGGRSGHSMCATHNSKQVVLFGGFGYSDILDVPGNEPPVEDSSGSAPEATGKPPRSKPKKGKDDTTEIALSPTLAMEPPPPPKTPQLLNDCWILDTTSWQWSKVQISGVPPAPRAMHSMVSNAFQLPIKDVAKLAHGYVQFRVKLTQELLDRKRNLLIEGLVAKRDAAAAALAQGAVPDKPKEKGREKDKDKSKDQDKDKAEDIDISELETEINALLEEWLVKHNLSIPPSIPHAVLFDVRSLLPVYTQKKEELRLWYEKEQVRLAQLEKEKAESELIEGDSLAPTLEVDMNSKPPGLPRSNSVSSKKSIPSDSKDAKDTKGAKDAAAKSAKKGGKPGSAHQTPPRTPARSPSRSKVLSEETAKLEYKSLEAPPSVCIPRAATHIADSFFIFGGVCAKENKEIHEAKRDEKSQTMRNTVKSSAHGEEVPGVDSDRPSSRPSSRGVSGSRIGSANASASATAAVSVSMSSAASRSNVYSRENARQPSDSRDPVRYKLGRYGGLTNARDIRESLLLGKNDNNESTPHAATEVSGKDAFSPRNHVTATVSGAALASPSPVGTALSPGRDARSSSRSSLFPSAASGSAAGISPVTTSNVRRVSPTAAGGKSPAFATSNSALSSPVPGGSLSKPKSGIVAPGVSNATFSAAEQQPRSTSANGNAGSGEADTRKSLRARLRARLLAKRPQYSQVDTLFDPTVFVLVLDKALGSVVAEEEARVEYEKMAQEREKVLADIEAWKAEQSYMEASDDAQGDVLVRLRGFSSGSIEESLLPAPGTRLSTPGAEPKASSASLSARARVGGSASLSDVALAAQKAPGKALHNAPPSPAPNRPVSPANQVGGHSSSSSSQSLTESSSHAGLHTGIALPDSPTSPAYPLIPPELPPFPGFFDVAGAWATLPAVHVSELQETHATAPHAMTEEGILDLSVSSFQAFRNVAVAEGTNGDDAFPDMRQYISRATPDQSTRRSPLKNSTQVMSTSKRNTIYGAQGGHVPLSSTLSSIPGVLSPAHRKHHKTLMKQTIPADFARSLQRSWTPDATIPVAEPMDDTSRYSQHTPIPHHDPDHGQDRFDQESYYHDEYDQGPFDQTRGLQAQWKDTVRSSHSHNKFGSYHHDEDDYEDYQTGSVNQRQKDYHDAYGDTMGMNPYGQGGYVSNTLRSSVPSGYNASYNQEYLEVDYSVSEISDFHDEVTMTPVPLLSNSYRVKLNQKTETPYGTGPTGVLHKLSDTLRGQIKQQRVKETMETIVRPPSQAGRALRLRPTTKSTPAVDGPSGHFRKLETHDRLAHMGTVPVAKSVSSLIRTRTVGGHAGGTPVHSQHTNGGHYISNRTQQGNKENFGGTMSATNLDPTSAKEIVAVKHRSFVPQTASHPLSELNSTMSLHVQPSMRKPLPIAPEPRSALVATTQPCKVSIRLFPEPIKPATALEFFGANSTAFSINTSTLSGNAFHDSIHAWESHSPTPLDSLFAPNSSFLPQYNMEDHLPQHSLLSKNSLMVSPTPNLLSSPTGFHTGQRNSGNAGDAMQGSEEPVSATNPRDTALVAEYRFIQQHKGAVVQFPTQFPELPPSPTEVIQSTIDPTTLELPPPNPFPDPSGLGGDGLAGAMQSVFRDAQGGAVANEASLVELVSSVLNAETDLNFSTADAKTPLRVPQFAPPVPPVSLRYFIRFSSGTHSSLIQMIDKRFSTKLPHPNVPIAAGHVLNTTHMTQQMDAKVLSPRSNFLSYSRTRRMRPTDATTTGGAGTLQETKDPMVRSIAVPPVPPQIVVLCELQTPKSLLEHNLLPMTKEYDGTGGVLLEARTDAKIEKVTREYYLFDPNEVYTHPPSPETWPANVYPSRSAITTLPALSTDFYRPAPTPRTAHIGTYTGESDSGMRHGVGTMVWTPLAYFRVFLQTLDEQDICSPKNPMHPLNAAQLDTLDATINAAQTGSLESAWQSALPQAFFSAPGTRIGVSDQDLCLRYEGEWWCDQPNGQGHMIYANDSGEYTGSWTAGRPDGKGKRMWNRPQGLVNQFSTQKSLDSLLKHTIPLNLSEWALISYEGTWKNGLPHGQGVGRFQNTAEYSGTWANGVPGRGHGTLTATLENGAKIKVSCEWMDGFCHSATGVFEVYTGEDTDAPASADPRLADVQGARASDSLQLDTQNTFLQGEHVDRVRQTSELLLPRAKALRENILEVYAGGFVRGLREDVSAVMQYKDGRTYSGPFRSGQMNGLGLWRNANNEIYKGKFVGGKKCGQGTFVFASGDSYIGLWENDVMHGQGILYIGATSELIRGVWHKGRLHHILSQTGAQ